MGGKAFTNTRRVTRTEVFNVQVDLGLKLKRGNYFCHNGLGSAGISETSGDIDLNIGFDEFGFADTALQLTELVGESNVRVRPGNNQIFTSYPIPNTDDRVQVDFMFTYFREWQTFSYASAGDRSAFKGLYRTELIKAAVAFNSNWTLMEGDQMVARIGPTFFHDSGLQWRHRHRPMRRDGTARVQEFQRITPEEFRALYVDAPVLQDYTLAHPIDACRLIFDSAGSAIDHFFSYETLVDALHKFYDCHSYAEIMRIYHERLNSLRVVVPEEILNEIHSAAGATAAA